jgi:hypothetical protein
MTTAGHGFLGRVAALLTFTIVTFVAATGAQAVVVRTRTAVAYRPVYRPVARTAAVVGTAAVIGSVAYSLPPSCSSVVMGGVAYQQCGSTWYQPAYAGTTVQYTVVNPPH